jgi:hypothetical protein
MREKFKTIVMKAIVKKVAESVIITVIAQVEKNYRKSLKTA